MGEDNQGNRSLKQKKAKSTVPSNVTSDFEEVIAFLKQRHVVAQELSPAITAAARKIHTATYSLIVWRFQIKRLPPHSQVFLDEIASDALQILPQALSGYRKTTLLLARSIVENVIRHIYFSDHPVEFRRANRDKKWYLPFESLFDYLRNHPDYMETERRFDGINRLSALYDELSAQVHGRKVTHFEMRRALREITLDIETFQKQAKLVERCAECSNFLLLVFHRDRVKRFPDDRQRIVFATIPAVARRVWRTLD